MMGICICAENFDKAWLKVNNPYIIEVMDYGKAKKTLDSCYKESLNFESKKITPIDNCIDLVLGSDHKTFKYILFTALLAKATDESIDILSLQKNDPSSGAYDARSLCHKVIVPFEKSVLDKVLGGSNEPYLNKPARFPRLTPENPVRKGKDKELLDLLCTTLPSVKTAQEARNSLIYLLHDLVLLREQKEKDRTFSIPITSNSPAKLFEFIMDFIQESQEGETLVLVVAGLYHLLYLDTPNTVVEVHPVNESGASSKEVSDLDVYQKDRLVISNELKDKSYTEVDVRHAVDKVIEAGGAQMFFIEGIHANQKDYPWLLPLLRECQEKNFLLDVAYIETFSRMLLGMIANHDANEFIHYIRSVAEETKFKLSTLKLIDEKAESILGLHR